MRLARWTVLAVLPLAVTLAACSGSGVAPTGPTPVPPTPTPVVVSAECVEATTGLLEALQDLDARLSVGLTKVDYGERVGDVRVAYERVDVEDLDPSCIAQVAVPLENALNEYIEANNRWSECFEDTDCDNDEVKPALQGRWASATRFIETAEEALPD